MVILSLKYCTPALKIRSSPYLSIIIFFSILLKIIKPHLLAILKKGENQGQICSSSNQGKAPVAAFCPLGMMRELKKV
jgi:hypothetical protein